MNIFGRSLIGFQDALPGGDTFKAFNPATGEKLEATFYSASTQDVDRAAQLATEVEALRAERKQVRSRIEKLLGQVDQLSGA